MLHRSLLLIAALTAAATAAAGQSAYKAPRTPWGTPDIQGYYLNRTTTPVERPESLGAKEFYTAEEFAAMQAAAAARPAAQTEPGTAADAHYDMSQFGLDAATTGLVRNPRTSLIAGPTGRVPPMTPEATKRTTDARNAARGHEFDGPENRGMAERCILWNFEGPPLMPGGYNPNLQIFQGPTEVVIRNEMMGGARIVRTDGRPHLTSAIRQWYGDSVGHWEGDTLVVDTTNFNDQPPLGRGSSRNLHVTERFTRTADDVIDYQFTVSDPSTWEQSWSGEYPIQKIKGPIYEYGCQEGNYGMPNILSGARAAEREAAAKK
ncbi:MAG: hypothetical protein ABI811_15050 [Acidobacteriota bacterium]